MFIFNRYINKVDHVWYDSSNVKYSACYDNSTPLSTLKVVLRGGATYIYKNVTLEDYMLFKSATSNGSVFNKHIVKNYKGIRLEDTDLEKLEEFKNSFMEETKTIQDSTNKFAYKLEINKETNEIRLKMGERTLFEGVEGQIRLIDVLNSMGLAYSMSEDNTPCKTEENFINENIIQQ